MLMLRTMIGLLVAGLAGAAWAQAQPAPFAAEISGFAEADRASPPKPCGLLFVGSSSIRLWDTLAADMAPHRVVNRGFGGSTISDVNLHFDHVVTPYRPRAIFFYAGENDVDSGRSPRETAAAFETFLRKKHEALGTTPVYFISLKPSKARFAQLPKQREVNAAIRSLAAKRRDLHYVDVSAAMLKDGRPRDIFQADDLHMNADGYRIWTRLLRPKVQEAAKGRCK
jgi:lysophospholipase L1-like esterase